MNILLRRRRRDLCCFFGLLLPPRACRRSSRCLVPILFAASTGQVIPSGSILRGSRVTASLACTERFGELETQSDLLRVEESFITVRLDCHEVLCWRVL